jgi:hypothetical protein
VCESHFLATSEPRKKTGSSEHVFVCVEANALFEFDVANDVAKTAADFQNIGSLFLRQAIEVADDVASVRAIAQWDNVPAVKAKEKPQTMAQQALETRKRIVEASFRSEHRGLGWSRLF